MPTQLQELIKVPGNTLHRWQASPQNTHTSAATCLCCSGPLMRRLNLHIRTQRQGHKEPLEYEALLLNCDQRLQNSDKSGESFVKLSYWFHIEFLSLVNKNVTTSSESTSKQNISTEELLAFAHKTPFAPATSLTGPIGRPCCASSCADL